MLPTIRLKEAPSLQEVGLQVYHMQKLKKKDLLGQADFSYQAIRL